MKLVFLRALNSWALGKSWIIFGLLLGFLGSNDKLASCN